MLALTLYSQIAKSRPSGDDTAQGAEGREKRGHPFGSTPKSARVW